MFNWKNLQHERNLQYGKILESISSAKWNLELVRGADSLDPSEVKQINRTIDVLDKLYRKYNEEIESGFGGIANGYVKHR